MVSLSSINDMNRIFSSLHDDDDLSRRQHGVLTASQFLGKEPGVKGYTTPEAFLSYAKSLREPEVQQLERFFKYVKNGTRIIGSLITRPDAGKRQYQHPSFQIGKSFIGTKVILEGGMGEFLNDYVSENTPINFTLEELIEEAKKG